jgi:hypothetical protein
MEDCITCKNQGFVGGCVDDPCVGCRQYNDSGMVEKYINYEPVTIKLATYDTSKTTQNGINFTNETPTVYTIQTTDEAAFRLYLDGIKWSIAMFEMDQWLREQIKYNVNNTEEQLDAYEKAREQLYEIMRDENLSFDNIP